MNLCDKSKEIDVLKIENHHLKYQIAELQFCVSCIYNYQCKELPRGITHDWIDDCKKRDWKNLNVYEEKYKTKNLCNIF